MKKELSRGAALVVGTLVLFVVGIVYAWSIYSAPFSENFGWTSVQLGACFTIVFSLFCVGGMVGSFVTAKVGSSKTIPAGGLLAALGYCLCLCLTAERIWLLYLSFAIAGFGIGMTYNAVLSNVNARFGAKRGTSSGVMLMGFGFSTLILGSLAGKLLYSPIGWKGTFLATAAAMVLVSVVGGIVLGDGVTNSAKVASGTQKGLTPGQMLKTRSFWLLMVAATINCFFGFGVIGHARYVALEANLAPDIATLTVGLVSVMNGLGRIFFGILHDRKGFRVSLSTSSVVFIASAVLAVCGLSAGLPAMVAVALMLGGLGNSAVPTILASVATDFYGPAHYGKNISILNVNLVPGSFGSTVAGAIETSSGSYSTAFMAFGALELPALVLLCILSAEIKRHPPLAEASQVEVKN